MQDQGDKGDGTLEEGQVIVDQEEATPLLDKFTAIEMQEQTEETGENLKCRRREVVRG